MDLQDGSPIDIATAGVRKPRSGSVRKPRSGAQTVVTVSPVSGSPARTGFWNEGTDAPAMDSDSMHTQLDVPFLSHSEKVRDSLKQASELRAHSQSGRMEGEERTELRMFQRRERKREDGRDASRSGTKSWIDSDAPERSFEREEIRRSGSPSYEVAKKAKDSSERLERAWRERESSERRHKDVIYRERDDYVSSSSWHKSRGSQDRDKNEHSRVDRDYKERPDYGMKDRAHRDRSDPSYTGPKDWKSKGHPRDKEYERGDRFLDLKDSLYKSRSVNVVVEADERHSNQKNHDGFGASHRNDRNSHMHDRESASLHRHAASGRNSHQGEQLQTENFSRSKSAVGSSSSFHEARGSEKGGDPSNVGDSRPIPKLKLKVGGITHTLNSDGKRQPEGSVPLSRTPHQSGLLHKKRSSSVPEPNRRRQRLILQEDSDDEDDLPPSSRERAQASDEDRFLTYLAEEPAYSRGSGGVMFDNNQNLQGVRKSSRVPKKRVFDGDDDVEVEPKRKRKKKVEVDSDEELYRIEEDELDHGFAEEEEIEMANDAKLKFTKRRRKSLDTDLFGVEDRSVSSVVKMGSVSDSRGGVPLTARQRALQSSKEGLADVGSNLIEFPEGLTQSVPKKQKEVLSAAERQLKKEEAAQKRRQQVEKAAKEIQAVAIQKILCQDSQRKKREGKLQKQREEIEQEKKAAAMVPASNSIRWVLGPNGTVVSFSQDLELPNIFSGPLSYPQERERCAGPSCTNAYKYRDSKTLLPLCSLQCYRAVQKKPSEAGLAH